MTLEELSNQYRPLLADESVAVRRSWEEMFKYTFKHYPKDTPLRAFNLDVLAERLSSSGIHQAIVRGYVKRWHDLLAQASEI